MAIANQNNIVYTSNLITSFCEEKGINKEFMDKLYYYLIDKARKNYLHEDSVVFYIKGFGTLYLTLSGVNGLINSAQKRIEKIKKNKPFLLENYTKKLNFYLSKKEEVYKQIKYIESKGIKRIIFLRKLYPSRAVKNGN